MKVCRVISVHFLELFAKEPSREEAIRNYPNLQKFSDEYCSFLLDCKSNISKALVIEMGGNFTIDIPFICLVKSFPSYLKKGIVDTHGHFTSRSSDLNSSSSLALMNVQNASSASTSISIKSSSSKSDSSSHNSMISSNYELNPELRETIRQLFSQAPLKLELNRTLEHKTSFPTRLMVYNAFIEFIVGL